ncbi:MAG: GNAT family N-acetyltransferase [Burkholderiaceae bacterium]
MIERSVRNARLNPTDLNWKNFLVATDQSEVIGMIQLRKHTDGSCELGSLLVAEHARNQGSVARMIDTLLAGQSCTVYMITSAQFAPHYRRWGFTPISAWFAPRAILANYLLGRAARVISFLRGLPPRQLVILESTLSARIGAATLRRRSGELGAHA